MVLPTAELMAARKRGYQRRTPLGVVAFVLIVLATLTPHILVQAAASEYGRTLISVSHFFVAATPDGSAFAAGTSPGAVGFGLSVTYLGLALQQIGSLLGLGTFWVLIAEEVGRWVRRFVMLAGVFLILGSATALLGYHELMVANIATLLGIAWLPTFLAGVTLLYGGWKAKNRLDNFWFWERPELSQR